MDKYYTVVFKRENDTIVMFNVPDEAIIEQHFYLNNEQVKEMEDIVRERICAK